MRSGSPILRLPIRGTGQGMDISIIREIQRLAIGDVRPDLTLLLDIPAEEDLDVLRPAAARSAMKVWISICIIVSGTDSSKWHPTNQNGLRSLTRKARSTRSKIGSEIASTAVWFELTYGGYSDIPQPFENHRLFGHETVEAAIA